MTGYYMTMLAAVIVGFAISAAECIRAYKEYVGNDFIKKENSEKEIRKKFITLIGDVSTAIFYAIVLVFVSGQASDTERMKLALLIFTAVTFVCMLLQGRIIKKDVLSGALDDSNKYGITLVKISICEVAIIISLVFAFISTK